VELCRQAGPTPPVKPPVDPEPKMDEASSNLPVILLILAT